MAVTLADLLVMFKGDTSQLDSSMDQTQGGLKNFAGNATKLLGGAVVAGAAAAGAAIVGVGAAAFNMASQVDTAGKNLAAQLGISAEAGRAYAEIAQDVFGNNFADSIGDAAEVVGQIKTALDGIPDEAIQEVAEDALRLRDAFGIDTAESIDAARTLMNQFGLDSQEAFDFIAKGFQEGLNTSDDFLDTIGEYSTQFGNAGFDAAQFFSVMQTGAQGGVLGTDKIADAVKEMGIILNEGGDDARAAFEAIGLNFDQISGFVRSGDESWADYFDNIVQGLAGIEDPMARSQAQAAIFGTMAEDLGVDFTSSVSSATTSLEAMAGATAALDTQYNTLGSALEGFKRQAMVALEPLGAEMLKIANEVLPILNDVFARTIPVIVSTIRGLIGAVQAVVTFIKRIFSGELTTTLGNAEGKFGGLGEKVSTIMTLVQSVVGKALTWLSGFWRDNGDTVMRIVGNTFDTVMEIIDTVLDTIIGIVTFALQLLNGDFEAAGATLVGIVERIWQGISTVFSNQFDSLRTLVTQFDWGALGRSIMEGIRDGIMRFGSGIMDALRSRIQDAVERTRRFFGIHSPSEKTKKEIGKPLIQGITEGINEEFLSLQMDLQRGLASAFRPPQAAAAAPAAHGAVNITIHVNGDAQTGQAVRGGVLSALRQAGLA